MSEQHHVHLSLVGRLCAGEIVYDVQNYRCVECGRTETGAHDFAFHLDPVLRQMQKAAS